jgi:hypothetical protein
VPPVSLACEELIAGVPPQVELSRMVPRIPVGRLSTMPTLVSAMPFELVRVIVTVEALPKGIVEGLNDLPADGGATIVRPAIDVLPVPPLVEVTVTELDAATAVIPFTFTEKVQVAPPVSVAPDRVMEVAPAVAVMVPPPQEPVRLFGVETTKPGGSVSVKATPVRLSTAFGFVMVKLRLVLPPSGMVGAPNVFLMLGAESPEVIRT